jgi:hypothetical protein
MQYEHNIELPNSDGYQHGFDDNVRSRILSISKLSRIGEIEPLLLLLW